MEYRHTHGGARIAAESSTTREQRVGEMEVVPSQEALTSDEFTPAGGEITPTLKLKRRVIEAKYKQQIEALYQ